MRINREQLRLISTQLALSNASTFVAELVKRFPEYGATPQREALRRLVSNAVPKAISYGIADLDAILTFLHLCVLLGEDFDRVHDWAYQILLSQHVGSSSQKMNYLYDTAQLHLRRRGRQ